MPLVEGGNTGVDIAIDREVYDFEASISGELLGPESGSVTIVAYTGEITSSDFTSLDFDQVIGFETMTKQAGADAYTLNILPYGKNVPIENVQVFALLDANDSRTIDGGDRVGFYGEGDAFSTPVTVSEGRLRGIDLEFKFTIQSPSGDDVFISGEYFLPNGSASDLSPAYLAVLDGSNPESVLNDPFASVRYFKKAPQDDIDFMLDLSNTGLAAGDEIIVVGLWDKNYNGVFPELSVGDFLGIYAESGRISPAIPLNANGNSDIRIDINREIYDFEASISGDILGSDTGDVTLVAYAGDIVSSDFRLLDFNKVIGFETVKKNDPQPIAYHLNIFPYGEDVPVENVQVIVLLDANKNQNIDGGDRVGFFGEGDELSVPLTVPEGEIGDIDIKFIFDVLQPSGFDILIAGSVPGPFNRTSPLYITVFDSEDPGAIIEDPFSSLKYFFQVPQMDASYSLDLSNTDLFPGDEVLIAGLLDKDFDGGFPDISQGDKIGIVQDKDKYQFTTALNCGTNIIPPNGYVFNLNKNVYEFDSTINYALDLSSAGSYGQEAKLIVLTIHVDGVEIGVSASCEVNVNIDIDYLLGVDILPASEYDHIGIGPRIDPSPPRNLEVITALYEHIVVWEDNQPPQPLIKGVDHGGENERTAYLFAILDKNGNNQLDGNDEIGYYGNNEIEIIDGKIIDKLPPWLKEIIVPDWFTGELNFPTPIPRITKGINREARSDGSQGPYWISHFIEP